MTYHLSNRYLSNIMKISAKNVHHLHGHMPQMLFIFQQDNAWLIMLMKPLAGCLQIWQNEIPIVFQVFQTL